MLLADTIKEIVKLQEDNLRSQDLGVRRDLLDRVNTDIPYAIIISGIRRCGKSTLLRQMLHFKGECNYFNFEDRRAEKFEPGDFDKLDRIYEELHPGENCYYFDEIQNVPGWERYVRERLDMGKRFVITGSNASLLSRELGTRLTGRHLTYELFPLSYSESLRMRCQAPSLLTFNEYMERGGFPGYVKYGTQEILQQLFEDIITRDIVVRYGLRSTALAEKLALYLLSNVGAAFSYTNLARTFNVPSTNTIIDFVSHYEDSYLLFTVPMYSHSFKKQQLNPKKVYAIDPGLIKANTTAFSENNGSLLENTVFLQLRRKYPRGSIYYYKEKRECDFVVVEKGQVTQALQVCYKLTEDNKDRELTGLTDAMNAFGLNKGLIITADQEDEFGNVDVVPAWKWLSGQGSVCNRENTGT